MIASTRTRYDTDDEKWDAVLRHDSRADGAFFFAVKTTGIYCRPSCRSRTPLRRNVSFYASCKTAEQAGFRPCKRCQPDGDHPRQREAQMVARACRILESSEKPPKLNALARAAGMSPFHFHRLFRKSTGLTPKAYGDAHRSETMRQKLSRGGSITSAIYDSGYSSNGRFYARADRMLGMKPRAFQKGGMGETLHFATGRCSLGFLLVAASEKGICAILLGDNPDALSRELLARFPKAHLVAAAPGFKKDVARVIGLVENPGAETHLPLDIRGTVFQQKVWNALTRIPPGQTATYAQVAKKIGRPGAVRAVGAACGANPLAIAIPCHRVVRTDGNLAGYRWGIERKKTLLSRESGRRE